MKNVDMSQDGSIISGFINTLVGSKVVLFNKESLLLFKEKSENEC